VLAEIRGKSAFERSPNERSPKHAGPRQAVCEVPNRESRVEVVLQAFIDSKAAANAVPDIFLIIRLFTHTSYKWLK
jgi:hypothetical protein